MAGSLALAAMVAACSRGPSGPAPTEDLRPSVIGVIDKSVASLPVVLEAE